MEFFAVCTELREQIEDKREKQRKVPYVTQREGENGFRNGNIGCNVFRNCTGDIGDDVSAGDERDGRNRYGARGSVHTA